MAVIVIVIFVAIAIMVFRILGQKSSPSSCHVFTLIRQSLTSVHRSGGGLGDADADVG